MNTRSLRRNLMAVVVASLTIVLVISSSVWADQGKIVVTNRASGTISVIDASSGAWIKDVALPAGRNFPDPMYVVNTWYGNRVWVGDRANNRVVVFNGNTFKVIKSLPVGEGVFHMWADAFGRQLWVINDIDNTVTVINANRMKVIATVPMPERLIMSGATPHDVTLDPFGFSAYVTFNVPDSDLDEIVQFNTWNYRERNTAMVGKFPHVSFNWRKWQLYSPCQNSDAVFVVNAATMAVQDIVSVPGAHGGITSLDATRFYTTNLPDGGDDAVFGINTRNNKIIGRPADTDYGIPHNLALTPNGRRLYVTHSGPNDKVSVFRVRPNGSLRLVRDVTVGDNPYGIGYVR